MRVRAAALLKEQGVTDVGRGRYAAGDRRAAPSTTRSGSALVAPPFSPHAFIETDKGTIEIELAVLDAPLTVDNFVTLARQGLLQRRARFIAWCPTSSCRTAIRAATARAAPAIRSATRSTSGPYLRGTVGMALDWEDTGGSQFFITHSPQPHLDARYTVFGHVVSGMDVVDRMRGIERVRIWCGALRDLGTG